LFHLQENHRGDFLRREVLGGALEEDLNKGLVTLLLDHFERPMLHVGLNYRIGKAATNETLCIEDCVFWVQIALILGSTSDQTL